MHHDRCHVRHGREVLQDHLGRLVRDRVGRGQVHHVRVRREQAESEQTSGWVLCTQEELEKQLTINRFKSCRLIFVFIFLIKVFVFFEFNKN